MAFLPLDDRREDLRARAVGQRFDFIDDLLGALGDDFLAADRAVRDADAGVQQAQIVVNLGHGADGRARVVADALLVNRDRRTEPFDLVDVGLFHLPQELAGIGAQAFDVAALSLGEDGVERQRRLARTR